VVVIEEGILLESVALIAHWAFLEPGLAISIYMYSFEINLLDNLIVGFSCGIYRCLIKYE
jgi:hypothetical protein